MRQLGERALHVEHLDIIQTLCRTGLATGSAAVRHQVERLRDALAASEPRTAAGLSRMLGSAAKTIEMRPNRLTRAALSLGGETLTPTVPMPVDRETSTPLAELVTPDQVPPVPPILPPALQSAIASLLMEWSNVDKLRNGGIEPITTALIYGPPGTGKTQLALWVGGQLGLPVVLARLDGLISSFLGTTSRNIGHLFAFAQRYRCILLLDEFDSIAKMRDDPQEVGEIKRVVNTLLQNLDSRKRIGPTIAITNHEGLLDPAIWRRFDIQIALERPSLREQLEIIERYAGPLDLSNAQGRFLAWCLYGANGAEIETMLRSIKRNFLISEPNEFKIVDAVREYAYLNSGRLDRSRSSILLDADPVLARALARETGVKFDQIELGQIFGVHRSTVARWLSQVEEAEPKRVAYA
jgi:hypothetical protein